VLILLAHFSVLVKIDRLHRLVVGSSPYDPDAPRPYGRTLFCPILWYQLRKALSFTKVPVSVKENKLIRSPCCVCVAVHACAHVPLLVLLPIPFNFWTKWYIFTKFCPNVTQLAYTPSFCFHCIPFIIRNWQMHRSKSGTCAVTNHQKMCNLIFISDEINEDWNFLSGSFSSSSSHTDYGSGDDDDGDEDGDKQQQQQQQCCNKCAVANNKQCVFPVIGWKSTVVLFL